MASPPFNPNEAIPVDGDAPSGWPALERTFRDIIKSWLTYQHDSSGHHIFPKLSVAARDAIVTWEKGSLCFVTDTNQLEIVTSTGPYVWKPVTTASGTAMLFAQTTAPVGWTKRSTSPYNDIAIRVTTGATGGNTVAGGVGVAAAFTVYSLNPGSGALDGTVLTDSQLPAHQHEQFTIGDDNIDLTDPPPAPDASSWAWAEWAPPAPGKNNMYVMAKSASAATIGRTGAGGSASSHNHAVSISPGTVSLHCGYCDTLIATKD